MRFLAVVLGAVLWAAMLPSGGAQEAWAEPAPGVAATADVLAAQAGTDAEARDYARREADSPEAQEFAGGDVGFFPVLLVAAMIVVVVLLFFQDEPA